MDYPARSKYKNSATAENYANRRFRPEVEARENRMLSELIARCQGVERVLDAPCGTGRIHPLLSDFQTIAMDISPFMVDQADSGRVHALVGDVGRMPFRDDSVELACCIRLLHHLPSDDMVGGFLRELARVSSRYVIITYYRSFALQHWRRVVKGWLRDRVSHRVARSWTVFRRLALEAGLEPVATRCSAPGFSEQYFVLFEVRT